MVQNLDTAWYNICHIIPQVLYDIYGFYIMALPSVMALSMVFQLPHIMFSLTSQHKIEHTTLMPTTVLLH